MLLLIWKQLSKSAVESAILLKNDKEDVGRYSHL